MIKKLSYIIVVIILSCTILFIFQIHFSKRAIQARKNEKNIELIKLGMNKFDVINIMGNPNKIEADFKNENIKVYYYEPTFGSSDGIYIYLENDLKVVYIKKNK